MSKYEKGEALPLEEGLYNTINPILGPFLHEKLGLTPNGITTITLLLSTVIIYLLYKNNYVAAVGLILFRQLLDATDGYVARRYNLQSEFGSKYDGFSDRVNDVLIFSYIILYYKEFIFENYLWLLPIIIILLGVHSARGSCIKKETDACKDSGTRHEVLKSTRLMSEFEMKIFVCLMIITIGIERDTK
jgi:phosphatidylglycerophosphate synthase